MVERPKPGERMAWGPSMRPVPLEDFELVEKVKAGQTEEFGHLVRKYQDRVFNTCWRISGNLEDARDLTQEAFLKAFENISGFHQQSGFYTWIFRVAVNLALSQRRKVARRRTACLDQSLDAAGTQAANLDKRAVDTRSDDPVDSVTEAELQRSVIRALHDLDDDHRAAVVLRDLEGMNYQEIGEILDLPPGTVRSRLHRARLALRRALLPALLRQR